MKIAIIAAMEREVGPLVRGWKIRTIEHTGRRYRFFEKEDAVVVCGGIGAEAARRATEAVIREFNPARVVSVGFAGALNNSLRVGEVVEPSTVINAADGVRTEVGSGEGILVSSASVAVEEQKFKLSKAYGGIAVDMEAGAVAQGALARGVEFAALKAISDSVDFTMPAPAMDRFVEDDGSFNSFGFGCYVALRPWLWGSTIALARNSSKASRALCGAIESYLGRQTMPDASLIAESNPMKITPEFAGAHTSGGTRAHTQAEERSRGQ